MRIIDLTLPITTGAPMLPSRLYSENPIRLTALSIVDSRQQTMLTDEGYNFEGVLRTDHGSMVSKLSMPTHGGTNIDAPRHFISDGASIDEVPLTSLVGECVVLDVQCQAGEKITLEHVKKYEHGIKKDDMVLIRSGWADSHCGTPEYLTDMPWVDERVAAWLVSKRVKAVAHDCFPDFPSYRMTGPRYPNHTTYLGSNVIIIENLVNTSRLSGSRFLMVALPLKLTGSDGSPARVIGIEGLDIGPGNPAQ
jgi:kynurenine formamidase